MSKIHVGPARVLAVDEDGRAQVQPLSGACPPHTAEWAIPFRYDAEQGDIVLIMNQAGRSWITGIIQGRGKSRLAFRGDTAVTAEGSVQLGGDGGARLEAPAIHIRTDQLESTSEHLIQHSDDATGTVTETVEERTSQCSRVIDENEENLSGRHRTVAERAVRIDGEMLRLS